MCIIDPNLEKRWIPNYGVWVEEWEALDKDLQVNVVVHDLVSLALSTLVLLRLSADLPFSLRLIFADVPTSERQVSHEIGSAWCFKVLRERTPRNEA